MLATCGALLNYSMVGWALGDQLGVKISDIVILFVIQLIVIIF